jgi:hypothetical protein
MQVGLILISCVLGIWKTFSLFCAKCILLYKFLGYHNGVDEDWDITLLNKLKMWAPGSPEMYLASYSIICVVLNILRSIKCEPPIIVVTRHCLFCITSEYEFFYPK